MVRALLSQTMFPLLRRPLPDLLHGSIVYHNLAWFVTLPPYVHAYCGMAYSLGRIYR